MKWFKHYTNLRHQPWMIEIQNEFGLARGYGMVLILLEECCKRYHDESGNEFTFSSQELQTLLGLKQNKLTTFLERFKNIPRTLLERSNNVIKIKLTNISELKDNYQKDLEADKTRLDKTRLDKTTTNNIEKKSEVKVDVVGVSLYKRDSDFFKIFEKQYNNYMLEDYGKLDTQKIFPLIAKSKLPNRLNWAYVFSWIKGNDFFNGRNKLGKKFPLDYIFSEKGLKYFYDDNLGSHLLDPNDDDLNP